MSDFYQGVLLVLLTASVMMQFCAAFFSIRLLRLSRYHLSWIMVSVALLLMALRRAVTFYYLMTGVESHPDDFYAEGMAFLISLLLVVGLFSIAPLMRKLYATPNSLFQSSCGTSLCELSANISSGVVVYSAVDKGKDFIIRYMNPAAARIEKIAGEHVIGRRLTEVFPGAEDFGLLDVLRRVWKGGRAEKFPLHYYQDGRISGWRDNHVYRRASGEVVAVYNDATAQMKMQEELEHREHKFRMLYEQAPLPYQSLGRDGKILEVNPAWLRLTGLNREQATGRNFNELLTREGRRRLQECLNDLNAGKTVSDVQLELRRSSGELITIGLDALALRNHAGEMDQAYCILREMESVEESPGSSSEEVEKEARVRAMEMMAGEWRALQMQKLALLGELTAGMAHELSAPLAAARNAFSLMRGDISPSSRSYEFAEIANQELARMADRIERMYRFHEPVSAEGEPIQINAMIDNALLIVRPAMRKLQIHLQDERAQDLPTVTLPPGAVMLSLINPLRNSVEAMSQEGVLTLRTGMADNGGVFVEIEDDGAGIPEDFLPHLFEPFATFQHGGRQQQDGLGLGLAAIRYTLDAMGGSVRVRSVVGEGTCIRLDFPAVMAYAERGD